MDLPLFLSLFFHLFLRQCLRLEDTKIFHTGNYVNRSIGISALAGSHKSLQISSKKICKLSSYDIISFYGQNKDILSTFQI